MDGKFEVSAGKQKTCRLVIRDSHCRLLARLDVLVGQLADP